jgi:hypothetical protein
VLPSYDGAAPSSLDCGRAWRAGRSRPTDADL